MQKFLQTKFLFFLLLILLNSAVFAANGKITGRIIDAETGEPLPFANVTILSTLLPTGDEVALSRPIGAAADDEGYYFILNVTPGIYSIKASIVGYTSITQKEVKVESDRTVEVNFRLSSSTVEVEQVVVTAEKELVKKDVSATQEIISSTRLEQMPVTRVDEFIGSIKGIEVVSGSEGNGLSVRGGAIRETDVKMDGISLRDPRTGNSYLSFNTTAIKEMQVLTGGFEAKYGNIRSGLLNIVTKEGQREKYTASIRVDVTPSGQKRFFGTNPWSNESWIYKVYAGEYAMQGVPAGDTTVPVEFRSFRGWARSTTAPRPLDSLQKLELWKLQHPQYQFANKPDYFIEGTITGPLPGSSIPIFGDFAEKTTFLLGGKYENSQLAFPTGPRDNYLDWNAQLKLTSVLPGNSKLSINGLYAEINTNSGGRTTSYGGALTNEASSFSFLNSTESSVRQQAVLIGGASFNQMFNKSRLQYYEQRYIVGGAKFTKTLSDRAFFTLDFQMGYTDQNLEPFAMDTSIASNFVYFYSEAAKREYRFFVPNYGSANASTNYQADELNTFNLFGGPQRVDSSHSLVFNLKGDFTAQLGRHHQFEGGFSARLEDFFIYSGTWFQSQLSYTPDTWQYVKATPLSLGFYLQDKLEFEGMILNAGLRLDYFNPMRKGFNVSFPLDDDYTKLLNDIYQNLPGESGSWERWSYFREYLDNPPGWPETENKVQLYLSPRMGVSFPITESSKMYFNYGHFYQRPAIDFLYDLTVVQGGVTIPTPGLNMAKTISYEFGYEQMFFDDFIINATAYYKDITGEPLPRTFINYYEDNIVTQYFPDAYSDIRGIELRIERPFGRFVTLNGMYDYMIGSYGQSGLSRMYENRLQARNGELRSPNVTTTMPRPRANFTLNLHTPSDFGPEFIGIKWLEQIYANLFFEWRDGGEILINPEAEVKDRIFVERVNFWNIDLRASKAFPTSFGNIEFVVTIQNLTNNKWLIPENMTQNQYSEYKSSLRTPDKGGDDKWGEYKSDDNHIKVGWLEAPIFLNPRRIILGVRLNF